MNINPLDKKISLFKTVQAVKEPYHITIGSALQRIQSGKVTSLVEKVREGDKAAKRELPIACWSGTFSERKDEALIEHSGFIILDFDDVNVDQVKPAIAFDDYTFACWVSPSGNGIKALIPITNPERHRDHFRAIEKYYQKQYGLEVDPSGINVSRACFESYDPNLSINEEARKFGGMISERAESQEVNVPMEVTTDYEQLNISCKMIRRAADGEKHSVLYRASRLCGGYIAAGKLEEEEVVRILFREIQKRDIDSEENAITTIRDGIEDGKKMPVKEVMDEREKIQREMKILDGDMSFISSDDSDYKWIDDFAGGRIELGLPVGIPKVDEHWRFKKNFTIINGHSNIGKTTFALYLQVAASMLHGWKWMVYSSENSTASIKMRLMEFAMDMPIRNMMNHQRKMAYDWVSKHFTIISNDKVYSFYDLLIFAEKLVRNQELDGIFIDPYNGLRIDMSQGKNLSTHEYHYEAVSEMLTFANSKGVALWLNTHAVTEAQRIKGADGLPVAPYAESTEGGGKMVNRADDFLTFHRKIQHPEPAMRRVIEMHVRKIRMTETGGSPTSIDDPIMFEMNNLRTSFRYLLGGMIFQPLSTMQEKISFAPNADINNAF